MDLGKTREKPFYYPLSDEPAPCLLFIQHYNLLSDPRMESWQEAIEQTVKPGDTVVDLGCGTGILSMIAARAGGRVFGVEVDPHLAAYARQSVEKNGLSDRVSVINRDACSVEIPGKADVIICEMLDTGLIKERQVQVMNCVLPLFAGKECTVIPRRVKNFVILSYTDFNFSGFELPLPFFETGEVRKTREYFSGPFLYQSLDLTCQNDEQVKVNMKVQVNRSGKVNSIKIFSTTELAPGLECGSSNWFNPPLVLPVEPLDVKARDVLSLRLSYRMGGGLCTLDYEVNSHE